MVIMTKKSLFVGAEYVAIPTFLSNAVRKKNLTRRVRMLEIDQKIVIIEQLDDGPENDLVKGGRLWFAGEKRALERDKWEFKQVMKPTPTQKDAGA